MVKQENDKSSDSSQSIMVTDEFMDWEERDSQKMTLVKHCIAGKLPLLTITIDDIFFKKDRPPESWNISRFIQ